MNTIDREAFTKGLTHGFKRIDLRKVRDDNRDEYASYVAGYALGFVVKLAILGGAAYYGVQAPV